MNAGNDTHHGRCLCGAIEFEAEGDAKWVAHCHCDSCRRHTASAMATFVGFPAKRFRFTKGTPKVYESSPERWRSFCGDCGSPLTYHANWDPGGMHVYLGVLDEPEKFPARMHVHYRERICWFDTDDDLKRYPEMSGS